MTLKEINIQNNDRNCPICNSNKKKLFFTNTSKINKTKYAWTFNNNISICKNCAFVFSSPAPDIKMLNKYYQDGITGYKKIGLPYSFKKRLSTLRRYKNKIGIFLEIGGDDPDFFHSKINKFFAKCLNLDISSDSKSKLNDTKKLEDNYASVIAHYDVLEHVIDLNYFLGECYRLLKPNGYMIIEVPNFRLYPKNLLIQEFEHVNHFTPFSLTKLLQINGFELIEINHLASRPYGFAGIFKKIEHCKISIKKNYMEYIDSKAILKAGIAKLKDYKNSITSLQKKILKELFNGKNIVLWGVTDLLIDFLSAFKNNHTILIVDSDPRRKNHLRDLGFIVSEPKDSINKINSSDILIICAPRYFEEIISWTKKYSKFNSKPSNTFILGTENVITLR